MSLSAKPSGKPLVPAPSTPVCSLILSSETNRLESSSPFRPLPLSPGPATQPPPALSPQPWHCAAARILLHSPTCCAARLPAYVSPLPPLASSHSSLRARIAAIHTVVSPCPVRTAPRYTARSPPAACAPSCPRLCGGRSAMIVPTAI